MPPTTTTSESPLPQAAPHPHPGWLAGWRGLFFAALLLAALVGAIHREVLFRGAIYHMDDAADNYYPARVAFARALHEGTLPSWEKDTMGGWPLLADPYYGYFYPLNFVFFLGQRAGEPPSGLASGVPAGLGLAAALHAWLAGLGMFIYLRRQRLSWAAAMFGAISFSLSSFLVVRIRHIIYVQMMAWVPFLLAAIDAYIQNQRRRTLALCALCVGLLMLAGAHSLVHFVALVLACYTLSRIGQAALAQPVGARLRFGLNTTFALVGAALIGALLSAVAVLPTLLALPHTARTLGTEYAFASTYAWPAWSYLRLLLMPDFMGSGEWRTAPWFGQWNHWELAGYYQGALALLLAAPGALFPSHTGQKFSAERIALLLLSVLAVLLALGDAGPVHRFAFHHVPLYGALRCPARALCMLVISLPILGAHGAEALFGRPEAPQLQPAPPSRQKLLRWLCAGGLAALVFGLTTWRALGQFQLAGSLGLPQLVMTQARAQLLAVCGGLAATALLCWVGRLRGALPLGLLGLLTAADQCHTDRGYVQPKPSDFAYGTERFHAVEWLMNEMAQPGPLARFVPDGRGPFRLLSIGETVGLESASGYSSMLPWRYVQLLYIINNGQPYPFKKLRYDPAAAQLMRLDSPLVDMLNIRYLISYARPSSKWLERFYPSPGLPPHARYEPSWDPILRVYENTAVMPRAYIGYQARLANTQALEASLLAQRDFDPHREFVLGLERGRSEPAAPPPPIENRGRQPGAARILQHQRHRVVIEAEAAAAGMLILADTYFPGWSATVDGIQQPIWPVNLAQRGVALAPGPHRVEMVYRDRALIWGSSLSLLGLLLTLALLVLRRAPPGSA